MVCSSGVEYEMLQTSPSDESIELVRETGASVFVINLCASTTPVTLAHPASAELKRFTFFVTRRREEGRERFRLHMGYFDTLAEAEAMLEAVRDVYPAAWAGPAPESRAPANRTATRAAMSVVPTPASAAKTDEPQAVAAPLAVVTQPVVPQPVAPQPVVAQAVVPQPVATTAPDTSPTASFKAPVELETMSNVREVLAALADEPAAVKPTPAAKAPPAKPAPAAGKTLPPAAKTAPAAAKPTPAPAKPEVAAAAPKPQAPKSEVPKPVAPRAADASKTPAPALTPAETLRLLETPAAPKPTPAAPLPAAAAPAAPTIDFASSSSANNIRILTPDDTQTLRDIKLDAQRNAPASYAVQLVWAVQPIDMESLPHLAIFDAYTLYHVEGNRQGRRWYGLRLGFFSDSSAARQVAQYVRSEYASVAVVPVTAKEKDGAKAPTLTAAVLQQPAPPRNETPKIPTVKPLEKPAATPALTGFELLPDEPAARKRDLDDGTAEIAAKTPASAPAAPGGKQPPRATGKPAGKRAVARGTRTPSPPGAPQPLESTLEILGASTLTIDESREIINDAAARRPPPKKEKPGRFARLLSRLSDKG